MRALEIGISEVRHRFPGDDEGSVALGDLRKDLREVRLPFVIDIDARLGAGKADVRLPREHGRHDIVGPAAV